MHGFQDASQDPVTLEVRLGVNSGEDTMSCDAMLRTTGSGSKEVAYAPLKVKNMVTVDSLDRTAGGSIDTYLSETSDKEVICIRHWDTAASDVTLTASDLDMWATKTDEITLEAEGLGDVLSRKDGDMEYSTLKVALPICPQPDSEIAAATQSIERKMSGSVAYDQLYGFATKQPQEVKTTIVNGGIVTLFNGADVLVRSGSQLQY